MQFFSEHDSKPTHPIAVLSYQAALDRLIYCLSQDYWQLEVIEVDKEIAPAEFTAQTDPVFRRDTDSLVPRLWQVAEDEKSRHGSKEEGKQRLNRILREIYLEECRLDPELGARNSSCLPLLQRLCDIIQHKDGHHLPGVVALAVCEGQFSVRLETPRREVVTLSGRQAERANDIIATLRVLATKRRDKYAPEPLSDDFIFLAGTAS